MFEKKIIVAKESLEKDIKRMVSDLERVGQPRKSSSTRSQRKAIHQAVEESFRGGIRATITNPQGEPVDEGVFNTSINDSKKIAKVVADTWHLANTGDPILMMDLDVIPHQNPRLEDAEEN